MCFKTQKWANFVHRFDHIFLTKHRRKIKLARHIEQTLPHTLLNYLLMSISYF